MHWLQCSLFPDDNSKQNPSPSRIPTTFSVSYSTLSDQANTSNSCSHYTHRILIQISIAFKVLKQNNGGQLKILRQIISLMNLKLLWSISYNLSFLFQHKALQNLPSS